MKNKIFFLIKFFVWLKIMENNNNNNLNNLTSSNNQNKTSNANIHIEIFHLNGEKEEKKISIKNIHPKMQKSLENAKRTSEEIILLKKKNKRLVTFYEKQNSLIESFFLIDKLHHSGNFYILYILFYIFFRIITYF